MQTIKNTEIAVEVTDLGSGLVFAVIERIDEYTEPKIHRVYPLTANPTAVYFVAELIHHDIDTAIRLEA